MGIWSEGYFQKPHQQISLVCLIWVGPHMVTTPLVKCFIWFKIALVCKWLSQLYLSCFSSGAKWWLHVNHLQLWNKGSADVELHHSLNAVCSQTWIKTLCCTWKFVFNHGSSHCITPQGIGWLCPVFQWHCAPWNYISMYYLCPSARVCFSPKDCSIWNISVPQHVKLTAINSQWLWTISRKYLITL